MKRLPLFALLLIGLWGLVACQQDEPSPAPTAVSEVTTNPTAIPDTEPAPPTAVPDPTATATSVPTVEPTPTTEPSPTPIPPKELTVCMSREPNSLYIYRDYSPQATAVRHAIYDSLYSTSGFVYQPRALADLPSVEIVTRDVGRGETVVNSRGQIITLRDGDSVLNAEGETITFEGRPIPMNEMVVEATFQPLVWSDGTAVTADDSLFSFELAADRQTPSDKTPINMTQSYTTTGELSVRWTGLPGHFASDYHQYVWLPLPRHQLGDISARDMLEERQINRRPLSYGPFVVADWVREEQMILEPNPHYYRTAEGLPYLDKIIIRFVPEEADKIAGLLDGSCDLVTSDSLPGAETTGLADLVTDERVQVYLESGRVLEHIAFGITQFTFNNEELRPDWFGDKRVRQAIAHCTDREAILATATLGISEMTAGYELPSHPLYPEDTAVYPYDPALGNALLDEVGFLDSNDDGIRQFVDSTRPFSITLQTTDNSPLRLAAVEQFIQNMADCGITVSTNAYHPTRFYSTETDGVIFRRQFDMAAFPWLLELVPACELYLSRNMPGPDFRGFVGWQASNVTGFRSTPFNNACETAQNALYGTAEYEAAHQEALRIFADELPILPLFARVKVAIAHPRVQNIQLDIAEDSDWWTVAEWDISE